MGGERKWVSTNLLRSQAVEIRGRIEAGATYATSIEEYMRAHIGASLEVSGGLPHVLTAYKWAERQLYRDLLGLAELKTGAGKLQQSGGPRRLAGIHEQIEKMENRALLDWFRRALALDFGIPAHSHDQPRVSRDQRPVARNPT